MTRRRRAGALVLVCARRPAGGRCRPCAPPDAPPSGPHPRAAAGARLRPRSTTPTSPAPRPS
ncbi:MAG: hypothetical protein M0C28_13180 [Candidatus Moduliflexus flocculans]|nr:hypothetical protein [Candidatus Moduliflexus flocculans]